MRYLFYILGTALFFSCNPASKTIVGTYYLQTSPKTTLLIKSDGTFEYTQITRNPYLFVSDHPSERFFKTSGVWTYKSKTLSLTSYNDSITYDLVKLSIDSTSSRDFSLFKFFDVYNDSIPLGPIYNTERNECICEIEGEDCFHWRADMKVEDSLEFHFFGYLPWRLISKNHQNAIVAVHLFPVYRPGIFKQEEFILKKGELWDKTLAKYIKK